MVHGWRSPAGRAWGGRGGRLSAPLVLSGRRAVATPLTGVDLSDARANENSRPTDCGERKLESLSFSDVFSFGFVTSSSPVPLVMLLLDCTVLGCTAAFSMMAFREGREGTRRRADRSAAVTTAGVADTNFHYRLAGRGGFADTLTDTQTEKPRLQRTLQRRSSWRSQAQRRCAPSNGCRSVF